VRSIGLFLVFVEIVDRELCSAPGRGESYFRCSCVIRDPVFYLVPRKIEQVIAHRAPALVPRTLVLCTPIAQGVGAPVEQLRRDFLADCAGRADGAAVSFAPVLEAIREALDELLDVRVGHASPTGAPSLRRRGTRVGRQSAPIFRPIGKKKSTNERGGAWAYAAGSNFPAPPAFTRSPARMPGSD
jgi:hypothetical protein